MQEACGECMGHLHCLQSCYTPAAPATSGRRTAPLGRRQAPPPWGAAPAPLMGLARRRWAGGSAQLVGGRPGTPSPPLGRVARLLLSRLFLFPPRWR